MTEDVVRLDVRAENRSVIANALGQESIQDEDHEAMQRRRELLEAAGWTKLE